MELKGTLKTLPRALRMFVISFVIALNIGFFTGFSFVRVTTSLNAKGIEQNYLGNEEDEDAATMYFKKSEGEVLTLIHNHMLSLAVIFFILGVLLWMTDVSGHLRSFLMYEPFVSLILTFGGIYVLWKGVVWFKYVIMLSGMAMVFSILLMSALVIWNCLYSKRNKTSFN